LRRNGDRADRTLSPYFVVSHAEPGVDALPLKATDVDVKVSGVIADVRVTQRYRNEGSQPIEARYLFPASTHAAVTAMTMRVGDRVVKAQIREKQAARREYEGAKQAGKSASLLEQQRPNVFQMSIANLMPATPSRSSCAMPRPLCLPTASIASSFRPSSGRATTAHRAAKVISPSRGSRSRPCAPAWHRPRLSR
jgi:hypothetical protein